MIFRKEAFVDYISHNFKCLVLTISACNEEINAASCTASTEFDNNYRCGNTIDGKPDTNWATQGQGVGSWIKLDFEKINWVENRKIFHTVDRCDGHHLKFNRHVQQIVL